MTLTVWPSEPGLWGFENLRGPCLSVCSQGILAVSLLASTGAPGIKSNCVYGNCAVYCFL